MGTRYTTQIERLAKDTIGLLNGPDFTKVREKVSSNLLEIMTTAVRMDARTGTIDPTAKKVTTKRRKRAVQLPLPIVEV